MIAPHNQLIQEAIIALYREARGVARPTPRLCVTPLAPLIGWFGVGLACKELSGLTSQLASTVLLQRGALLEPLEGANEEPLAGFFFGDGRWGSIFINSGDILVRRRFSAAHELGHYWLHFRPRVAVGEMESMIDIFQPPTSEDLGPDQLPDGCIKVVREGTATPALTLEEMEAEANQFAAELLMPKDIVLALVENYRPALQGEDLVWRLATDLLVSRAAMRWRLRSLAVLESVG